MTSDLVQGAITLHRVGGLNNRHLFLLVLEAGKYKVNMPAHTVPTDNSVLVWFSYHMVTHEGAESAIKPLFHILTGHYSHSEGPHFFLRITVSVCHLQTASP